MFSSSHCSAHCSCSGLGMLSSYHSVLLACGPSWANTSASGRHASLRMLGGVLAMLGFCYPMTQSLPITQTLPTTQSLPARWRRLERRGFT